MSKKDIISLIEKIAQMPTPEEFGPNPVATKPVNKPSGFTQGLVEVKNMQIAMQNLAYAVVKDANSSLILKKPKSQVGPMSTGYQQQSKDAFNDFMAEQYIGTLDDDKKGVQWDKSPGVVTQPGKQKTEKDVDELDAVMDTMYRVGPASNEFKPDGVWGWRTANALKNMLGFAWALLHIQGDFGLSNKEYTLNDWNVLDKLLDYPVTGSKVGLSVEDQKERAPKISAHLKKITLLYNNFRNQILAKPAFKKIIDGKKGFDTYNKSGSNKDAIFEKEQQLINSSYSNIPVKFTVNNKEITQLPLKAISNKDEYLKYMKVLGASDEMAIEIFNNYIKPQVEAL